MVKRHASGIDGVGVFLKVIWGQNAVDVESEEVLPVLVEPHTELNSNLGDGWERSHAIEMLYWAPADLYCAKRRPRASIAGNLNRLFMMNGSGMLSASSRGLRLRRNKARVSDGADIAVSDGRRKAQIHCRVASYIPTKTIDPDLYQDNKKDHYQNNKKDSDQNNKKEDEGEHNKKEMHSSCDRTL
ncbi:hypothetical protein FB45DRAFT_1095592 [Roridomyces roridus]|uniref:Uncharacterized protein n=1 Tax=Roridomyces roridus TaxID=1738132 RepID=A0AAD7BFC2_9AGAR|nr:hypothetical protein FB45DRAFT_1095592 [Roridomyces roridus]